MSLVRRNAGLGVLLAVTLLVAPALAWAQEASRTYGPDVSTSHTIQAFAFAPVSPTHTFDTDVVFSRFCTSALACRAVAPALLPAGALVTALELEACDTNATKSVQAQLFRVTALSSATLSLATASTGSAATPGCSRFLASLGTPEAVDNLANTYVVQVDVDGTDNTVRFQAVRAYYQLQVSPAPVVATFADVPTSHPFFRNVEALAASGITRGCSVAPPLYCPDDFVTRAQMAAFISKALGLQFGP